MGSAVLFLVSPVCRLITRPRWFLQHWEEVKQSATHAQPLRGDNRLQTHRQTLRSEGPAKTTHYDTLHSFFYSTAPPSPSEPITGTSSCVKNWDNKPPGNKAPNLSSLILPRSSCLRLPVSVTTPPSFFWVDEKSFHSWLWGVTETNKLPFLIANLHRQMHTGTQKWFYTQMYILIYTHICTHTVHTHTHIRTRQRGPN